MNITQFVGNEYNLTLEIDKRKLKLRSNNILQKFLVLVLPKSVNL